ncbi:alpha-ketoglutarate-dependent taurine dioxygenase [Artomyces pyxidatus]|uniref:Alpha-ketoglutarate-dependent taurine dioxygenase n=1 Tax=Artomyces pyxidatus TaxID=48021 RepID=A0ACB8SUM1_9AGAM|nr:alpha-ketoglutarate-dependent taurine dioxygenase [Artomyces pyxidatus]
MAPSLTEVTIHQSTGISIDSPTLQRKPEAPKLPKIGPAYPFYLPYFDTAEKFPAWEDFEHTDPGLRADPAKPHLLAKDVQRKDLCPYIGTELKNVQLSQLSKEGLDEVALFVAERKMVIFRDQDFKDIGPDRQIEIVRYFGPLHRHLTSANVKGYPEFNIVYRDAEDDYLLRFLGGNSTSFTTWHSDISYERQPPGTTLLFMLEPPAMGSDTIFASQVEAYNRLSPEFKKRLEGLKALHSSIFDAKKSAKMGRPVRREPIETEHPVVRQHPVTGEKALFINPIFTNRIVGFKAEESEYLLKFLFDHMTKGADFQVRATYEPGTVVVWDNRVVLHSGTTDSLTSERRHAVRLASQAEAPIPA